MDTRKLIVAGTILLIVGALIVIGVSIKGQSKTGQSTGSPAQPNKTENQTTTTSPSIPAAPQFSGKEQITLIKDGFNPASITIKAGTLVQWINQSGANATVNSDNHPTHQLYPPLNLGMFPDGSSVSLIFDKQGTYTYHDHLHPERTGSVTVE